MDQPEKMKFQEELKNISPIKSFRQNLEKNFFGSIHMRELEDDLVRERLLALDVECPFALTDLLFQLNTGNWGGFKQTDKNALNPFQKALFDLRSETEPDLDIGELTFILNDTTIIISRIDHNSISDQLHEILNALADHLLHFSRGLSELPFEIFVPIFEERHIEAGVPLYNQRKRLGYLKFWGLYFDSDEQTDPVIYDLEERSIVEGDFYLLNA